MVSSRRMTCFEATKSTMSVLSVFVATFSSNLSSFPKSILSCHSCADKSSGLLCWAETLAVVEPIADGVRYSLWPSGLRPSGNAPLPGLSNSSRKCTLVCLPSGSQGQAGDSAFSQPNKLVGLVGSLDIESVWGSTLHRLTYETLCSAAFSHLVQAAATFPPYHWLAPHHLMHGAQASPSMSHLAQQHTVP